MVTQRLGVALGVIGALAGGALAAVAPIVGKGQFLFFSGNGSQFYIRGVAYQQGVNVNSQGDSTVSDQHLTDPLADAAACTRDIPLLRQLGTNTIRVYAIDPTKDHSACMKGLDAAGIYVIADMSSPDMSIERDNPAWTTREWARYQAVIDNLAPYPNTLGFFAGNEVTNNDTNTRASAYVKAAVRDSKRYIASRGLGRWLGVGYATNDDGNTRNNLADYFNCGPASDSVDFWGYNIYEWCGTAVDFHTSGYEERTKFFQSYNVPVFFSEYGCQNPGGADSRQFLETAALYNDQMNRVWSGGIVYEYFQEQNDYGLVQLSGTSVSTKKNFNALATQIAKSGYPAGLDSASYKPSNTARACPAVATAPLRWQAAEALPPTPNATVCGCMYASLSCRPSAKLVANATALGAMFGTVCGLDKKACAGIEANPAAGTYGLYSMCNATEKLAHALNAYYIGQNSASTACDFGGNALLQAASGGGSQCSAVLASASASANAGPGSGGTPSRAPGRVGGGLLSAAAVAMSLVVSAVLGAAVVVL